MKKGLFDPKHLKAVNEMRKTWKFVYPTQESITQLFKELREGITKDIEDNPDGYWANLKNKK